MSTEEHGLTAREMFDTLLAGKKVQLIATCAQDPEIVRLMNHLNVIKSRSKAVYESLGLNWTNSIIQAKPSLGKIIAGDVVTLSLVLPIPPKKYSIFSIVSEDEQNNNDEKRE